MIIIESQDRDFVGEVEGIQIRGNKIVGFIANSVTAVGIYDSEERARKVYRDINNHVELALDEQQKTNEHTSSIRWIFIMPEE